MDLEIYDAQGRIKTRSEIPFASGQYVQDGIKVATGLTTFVATAGGQFSTSLAGDLVLTGDGINGMMLEGTGFSPYSSPGGATDHFQVGIHDVTSGAPSDANELGSSQFRVDTVGQSSGLLCVRGYVPPFTGTKTFRMALRSGIAATYYNQATATKPTIFTAQWAHPTKIVGPNSPPAIQWFAPTYQNSWVDYAAPYGPCNYGKLADGVVHLRGLCTTAAATGNEPIFILPAGFRPARELIYSCACDSGPADVRVVGSTGVVYSSKHTAVAVPWISLANVSFPAEQ